MAATYPTRSLLRRHIALPAEHGSWVFLLSPLLVGLFAGGRWTPAIPLLVLALLAAFLIRQPATIAVKAYSGRRSRADLPTARAWIAIYGLIGLLAAAGLAALGFGYLLILAVPGIPVFVWHLVLVSHRAERRQLGVELVAGGVLALAAPAAYWVARGYPDPSGWWLWGLTWLQSAASIVYAYLRLEQRRLEAVPDLATRWSMGRRALATSTFNVVVVAVLSMAGILPALLVAPYAVQWVESLWGTLRPAVHIRPTVIGVRQLIVSSIFTVLFILVWRM